MKRQFILLLVMTAVCLVFSGKAKAQDSQTSAKTITVSGTIVDEDGLPAIGASVVVVGRTGIGTVADAKGYFSLSVPVGSVLQVSYIGYADQTRTVNRNVVDWYVQLVPDSTYLDDAVVVGYGVQKKESIVGSISSVSADQLNNTGTQSLVSSLSGKVSGLLTTTTSGRPGGSTSLLIRGLSSFQGTNEPLVMVDGVERSMDEIDPNEVQSISVLKDASATAVFGSKGANGVVIVTTKSGTEGRAKMHVRAEMGGKSAVSLPYHVDPVTTIAMRNIAYKNDRAFASQYSDYITNMYATGADPYRYPNENWYDIMMRPFAPSFNATFDVTGGNKRLKYYAMASYYNDTSILRSVNTNGPVNWDANRINYRLNLDANLTSSTTLSLRMGGSVKVSNEITSNNEGGLFNQMYMWSGFDTPAYYPESIYELYPDPNYPDASGVRLSNTPYQYIAKSRWEQHTSYTVLTDLILNQKLDFITKGLSAKAMVSITNSYYRISSWANHDEPIWTIDWTRYDLGVADIWNNNLANAGEIYEDTPFKIAQGTSPDNINFTYYLEGALNYARTFKKHDVSAMVVYNQRQFNQGESSPHRNQSVVGRVTYNYDKKYLFEANLGITGSEQFAPKYRYGVFPAVAAGYTISQEKFWKKALPWWSKMKLRFSWGLVGNDNSTAGFLYYSAYSRTTSGYDSHYIEGTAANEGARWETADKKDIGIEMGFWKDKLTVNVDLFDEYRYDILMSPVITPLVGAKYKDTNSGAVKKHGIDIDILWRETLSNGFFYSIGALVGLNENRIVRYADIPYDPDYKKVAGTPSLSQTTGSTLIDDKYFQNINEIHGYPAYTANWVNLVPGSYKFMDYLPDGIIASDDLHVIRGSSYAPCTYSVNLSLGYKGFTFRAVGTGTIGKYTQFKRAYIIPFYGGRFKVHQASLDYWSPTNRDASSPALTESELSYSWAGGKSTYPGYDLALQDYTWRNSDYFNISELYLGYKFSGNKLQTVLGIDALTISLSTNNLWMFTSLIEGNPQDHNTSSTYYPLMRTTKLGINLNF